MVMQDYRVTEKQVSAKQMAGEGFILLVTLLLLGLYFIIG